MDNDIQVSFDNNEIPQTVRSTFLRAKVLGVVSSDRASIMAADLFETRGGYTVKIDRVTAKVGEMTGSERREALTNLCKSQRPDVATLARITKTESNSAVESAITGRAKVAQNWSMDLLTCGSGTLDSFGGKLSMNVGIYNAKKAELEEAIGTEIGTKILTALGKIATSKDGKSTSGVQSTVSNANPGSSALAPQAVQVPVTPAQASDSPGNMPTLSIKEIQQRLAFLGYQVGIPDGVAGKRTTDAVKKFQSDNQLTSTGLTDGATTSKLISKSANFSGK